MAYRNSEGYSDPTAGEALGNIMREYRQQRRETWQRQYELRTRPKVYIVSRYAGDIPRNVAAAIRFCRFAIGKGMMPIASHLLYPQVLRDDVPAEREMGTAFGLALLALCDEVWVFNEHTGLSPGMQAEVHEAKRLNKPVRFFDTEVSA